MAGSILEPAASAEAVFFILPLLSDFGGPGTGQFCLFRVKKTRKPDFGRLLKPLSVSLVESAAVSGMSVIFRLARWQESNRIPGYWQGKGSA
jgi:hypothetical protein